MLWEEEKLTTYLKLAREFNDQTTKSEDIQNDLHRESQR